MKTPQPSTIGPYKIIRRIGEGGMGVVYEAIHEQIERRVAIKCLHPDYAADEEAATRFFNEARAVNRINHPSLVQISDYGKTAQGSAYIVMEYLNGQTLAQRLHASEGLLPLMQTMAIGWQIAAALTAAHEKQIIHRDLKPDNVMLVADPVAPGQERAKLLDFGIAKFTATTGSQTATSIILGTPRYMSPEQCKASGGVDDRTDVYSLGVMLFEMLAGRPPFEGDSAGELIAQHLYKEPPRLASLAKETPLPLVALVERLLKKLPDERPRMREVAQAFEDLGSQLGVLTGRVSRQLPILPLDGSQIKATTTSMRGELPSQQRSTMLIGGVAALALVLLISAGLLLRGLDSSARPPIQADSTSKGGAGTAAATANPPMLREITWTLLTTPPGASVQATGDGRELGRTPLVLKQKASAGKLSVTVRLSGYVDRILELPQGSDVQLNETLVQQSKRGKRDKKASRLSKNGTNPLTSGTGYED